MDNKLGVLLENNGSTLRFAFDELRRFLGEAGVSVCETDAPINRTLSLGMTDAAKKHGFDKLVGGIREDGFFIKTVGETYFIVSPTDLGVLFGVYTFLHEVAGWEFYAVDEYTVADHATFRPLDIREEPDFDFREYSWLGYNKYDMETCWRLRVHVPPYFTFAHTFFQIMPKEKYFKDHPDWYSQSTTQLCITNEEMIEEFIKNSIEIIDKSGFEVAPTRIFMVGHEDNDDFCTCDKCRESDRRYGGPSGTMLRFVNRVAKALNEHVAEKYPGKTVKTITFAYGPTIYAPVDEHNNPVHPSVMAEKNVGVVFAPLFADYSKPFCDREHNADVVNMFEGYHALGVEPYIWTYNSVFDDCLVYFSEWHNVRKDFEYFKRLNAKLIIDMGHPLPDVSFDALSNYVRTKMLWNLKVDEHKLIDDFFNAYYKNCAPVVRRYFEESNAHQITLKGKFKLYSERSPEYKSAEAWPKELLVGWIEDMASAEKTAVSEKVALRVKSEKLSPLYLLLECYAAKMSKEELKYYIEMFDNDAAVTGLIWINETGPGYMNDVASKMVKWRSLLLK